MHPSLRRLALIASVAVPPTSCHDNLLSAPDFPDSATRVLFIGNSLTYQNDLPSMMVALARQAGDTQLQAATVAFPDYALEDHWAEGTARRFLTERKWEYVVMQQGSSALPASQVNLRAGALQFAPLIRAAGAEPVMYMVWPSRARLGDFPAVLQSYRNAAMAIDGIFAPAGDAWTAYGDLSACYAFDGLHPTVRGTYLAALVLLERIRHIAPESLPPSIPGVAMAESEVRALQRAARLAIDRNPAHVSTDTLTSVALVHMDR